MSPGTTPEDPAPAAVGSSAPAAEQRLRLQSLAGVTVLGSDGRTVGRVRDIYQQDDSGELAAITVMPRQLSSRTVLIPVAAIAALPAPHSEGADGGAASGDAAPDDAAATARQADAVHLSLEAAVARAGLRPPETGHATAELLREAAAALGLAAPAPDAAPAPGAAPASGATPEHGGRGRIDA